MRRLHSVSLISMIVVTCAFAWEPQVVFAAAGELDKPSVAFSEGYPKADRERVMCVLGSEKVTFVGGNWINSFTLLKYRGDTKSLSLFLEDLAKCRGVTVHVSFKRSKNSADILSGIDWTVNHTAGNNAFQVLINLSSQQIDLESLYLPEIRATAE